MVGVINYLVLLRRFYVLGEIVEVLEVEPPHVSITLAVESRHNSRLYPFSILLWVLGLQGHKNINIFVFTGLRDGIGRCTHEAFDCYTEALPVLLRW